MARRASSSTNPVLVISLVVVAILLAIIGKMILGGKSSEVIEGPTLDVEELLENGNSLRGNEYTVTGTVDEKLRWDSSTGRVVSLIVESSTGDQPIPIVIPKQFKRINIERNQRYSFKVQFQQGGVPIATEVNPL